VGLFQRVRQRGGSRRVAGDAGGDRSGTGGITDASVTRSAPGPANAGWRALPPIPTTWSTATATEPATFEDGLTTRVQPRFVQRLSHQLSPDAPGGLLVVTDQPGAFLDETVPQQTRAGPDPNAHGPAPQGPGAPTYRTGFRPSPWNDPLTGLSPVANVPAAPPAASSDLPASPPIGDNPSTTAAAVPDPSAAPRGLPASAPPAAPDVPPPPASPTDAELHHGSSNPTPLADLPDALGGQSGLRPLTQTPMLPATETPAAHPAEAGTRPALPLQRAPASGDHTPRPARRARFTLGDPLRRPIGDDTNDSPGGAPPSGPVAARSADSTLPLLPEHGSPTAAIGSPQGIPTAGLNPPPTPRSSAGSVPDAAPPGPGRPAASAASSDASELIVARTRRDDADETATEPAAPPPDADIAPLLSDSTWDPTVPEVASPAQAMDSGRSTVPVMPDPSSTERVAPSRLEAAGPETVPPSPVASGERPPIGTGAAFRSPTSGSRSPAPSEPPRRDEALGAPVPNLAAASGTQRSLPVGPTVQRADATSTPGTPRARSDTVLVEHSLLGEQPRALFPLGIRRSEGGAEGPAGPLEPRPAPASVPGDHATGLVAGAPGSISPTHVTTAGGRPVARDVAPVRGGAPTVPWRGPPDLATATSSAMTRLGVQRHVATPGSAPETWGLLPLAGTQRTAIQRAPSAAPSPDIDAPAGAPPEQAPAPLPASQADAPADVPAPAPASAPAAPSGPTAGDAPAAAAGADGGAKAAGGSGGAAGGDLDELSRKLYDRLRDRLTADFRLERERAGILNDLGGR